MRKLQKIASIFLKLSEQLSRHGKKYNTSFYGNNDGTWTAHQGFLLGALKEYDWEMIPSMSSKNDWANFSVEGATEHNQGFLKALNEIVDQYPEVMNFLITFDGPAIKISELLSKNESLDWSTIKLYHGTSQQAWEAIQQIGLKSRSVTQSTPIYGAGVGARAGREDAIYLTTQLGMAHFAALEAGAKTRSDPVVLEVSGLDGEFVVADEDSGSDDAAVSLSKIGSVGYVKDIPPQNIRILEVCRDREWIKV